MVYAPIATFLRTQISRELWWKSFVSVTYINLDIQNPELGLNNRKFKIIIPIVSVYIKQVLKLVISYTCTNNIQILSVQDGMEYNKNNFVIVSQT